MRTTLRWRLTAIYGALFFFAGGVLVGVTYEFVRASLPDDKIAVETVSRQGGDTFFSAPAPDTASVDPPPGAAFVVNGQQVSQGYIASLPARLRHQALHDLVIKSLLALLGVGLASLALGWWLAGRALRPLRRITDTARRLSDTNLDERIALPGPHDELRELADTFDAMLERLHVAFESQRRFVANASHEMRTPLAIMRAQLEVADSPEELAAAAGVVQQVIDRSERLVDGLLVLARADGEITREDTDLADALHAAATVPANPTVQLTLDAEPAPLAGDPALLAHLARNLLDNAGRYNVDGGWVRARTGVDGDDAVLVVENSGPPVLAEEAADLFEPFRRGGADRTGGASGAGLGLSIVRAVARAHGGDATATPLTDGGLRVEVRLPATIATVTAHLAGVVQRQNISFPS